MNKHPLRARRQLFAALAATFATALLSSTALAQGVPVANPYDQTRASSFTYRADGLLESETIEPDNAKLCVTTTYSYDAYGNKASASTANCTGASGKAVFTARSSISDYSVAQTVLVAGVSVSVPKGSFPITVTNALGHTETKTFDPRFGAVRQLVGPNALATTWELDDLGRKTRETRADGTSSVVLYCYLAGRVANTSSNSTACPTPTPAEVDANAEIPADAVLFVHSEPRNKSDAKNGPFNRVYSDRAGRQLRSVTEAFDGASQPGGASRLIVQDTGYNAFGAQVLSTQPYFLDSRSSTSTGANDLGATLTMVDALGRPTTIYSADPQGSSASVTFPNGVGARQAAITTITYNGLATTTTNDKNQTRVEEKNIEGQLVRVTDALGAQLAHQHDAFGNLVATKDALQNTVTLAYDLRGRKVQMNDPDTGLWKYDYNALGELVWQQSPNQRALAQSTTLAYDKLGRMFRRVEPEYTSTWTFDTCARGKGKLCTSTTSNGVTRKLVYDSLGRPLNTRTTVTNGPSFASAVSYDSANGRLAKQTYPTGLQVAYSYTAKGFLSKLTLATAATVNPLPATPGGAPGASVNLAAGSLLWQALATNARGQAEQQRYGNNVTSKAKFDALTGRVDGATAGISSTTNVLNHSYAWNSLGHLRGRTDANGDGSTGAVTDSYVYDSIGRLKSYSVAAPAIPNLARSVTLQYNALGNLLYKSDVGIYRYGPQGAGQVRPHALQSVSGAINAGYTYDANGNLTTASGGKLKSIAYTSFNLPDSQSGIQGWNASQTTWQYDENHQRIKETRSAGGATRVTWNLHPDNQGGLGFESESTNGGTPSNRHYLSVGGASIGVLVSTGALPTLSAQQTAPTALATVTLVKLEYWHKDHLGSLISTTDHSGAVTARYAYDPFGKRRFTSGRYDEFGNLVVDWTTNTNNGTDRGYTGHEHLDDVGLVHMNGRLFDPTLGVFLQGDPFIQDPGNLQNYNRYGYCFNNPLTCADPSGFFSFNPFSTFNLFHSVGGDAVLFYSMRATARSQVGYQIGSIAIGVVSVVYCNVWAAVCNGAGQAAWAGFAGRSFEEAARIGVISGLTAQAFTVVGSYSPGAGQAGATPGTMFGNTVGHALVGCASASASGGNCRNGALAAGFSAAYGNATGGYSKDIVKGTMQSAAVGGIGSVIGGGKFGNGAVTGAFGYLFNQAVHPPAAAANAPGEPIIDPTWGEIGAVGELLVPGGDLVACSVRQCTPAELVIAAAGVIPGGKGVALGSKGLAHVMARHIAGGAESAGKSLFHNAGDLSTLATNAASVAATPSRGNLVRVVDAGRVIGIDRASGQGTSVYTVVTNRANEVVTMHPGKPR